MASLQRIRQHGAIVLIIVGLAMLAFIMGDFLTSSSSFFNRSREYVGKIEGDNIHITDYENQREQLTEVYKIESGSQEISEDLQSNINDQVWNLQVLSKTLGKQARLIGMTVTDEELTELCVGQHPHELIRGRRIFQDENGEFSAESFQQFYSVVYGDDESDQFKQWRTYWMYWEKAIRLTYLQQKYQTLLSELLTANSLDAKTSIVMGQQKADVEYVKKPYYTVGDSLVNVSSKEIKKLYKARKSDYKREPACSMNYVAFNIVPSEDDYADVERWINRLAEEFKTTEDVASVVNSNSDILYRGENYSEQSIMPELKDWAFDRSRRAGDVTDIAMIDDTYMMARMMENGISLPDSVEVRVTVVGKESVDSLKKEWQNGKYGELEAFWVSEQQLPKDLAEKVFSAAKNAVLTDEMNGDVRVIKVTDKSALTPKVKVAILARTVSPSSKTYASIYNSAKQFSIQNNTETKFNDAAAELGLQVMPVYNLKKTAHKVNNLPQSRSIVRWLFGAKEGEVSDVFECGDQFIVALATELQEGDYRSLSEVSAELRRELIREKKAAYLTKELGNVSDLKEAAERLEVAVEHQDDLTLSSNSFANVQEPAAVGAAFALSEGEMSGAVEGKNNLYVVKTLKLNKTEGEPDAEAIRAEERQLSARNQYIAYQAINLIEKNAKIEDNRANFY